MSAKCEPSPFLNVPSTQKIIEFGPMMYLGGTPGNTGSPITLPEWTVLPNVASGQCGAEALWCSNDSFAGVENLVKDHEAVWDLDRMTDQGKWMDGWETRRHNKHPYDIALVQLIPDAVCFLYGFCVDTSHFSGNHSPAVSIEVANISEVQKLACLIHGEQAQSIIEWKELLPRTTCIGCYKNFFEIPKNLHQIPATHLRIKMYPDGGIARLRAFGMIHSLHLNRMISLPASQTQLVDLALLTHGGLVTWCTNSHFGSKSNMIKPGLSLTMKDGWETRRSRDEGHIEQSIIQLGHSGFIDHFIVDTRHFKNNSPDFVRIDGLFLNESQIQKVAKEIPNYLIENNLSSETWTTIIEKSPIVPHRKNYFLPKTPCGPFSHIRITMFPDGGISRVRVMGFLTKKE